MFLGHYGLALAAKRVAPRTSLGTLFMAAQLLDEIWPVLLLAGLERVRIVPGSMAASPFVFDHYPWSHSLLMTAAWGVVFGLAYYFTTRYKRGAWVVGAVVVSHWFLDAPMHRPDLPLWPGSDTLIGGALWNSIPVTLLLEFAVLGAGAVMYLRSTSARDRIGKWGFTALLGTLVLAFLGSFASAPPNPRAVAFGGFALWLFVLWAYWVDRHRTPAEP